MKRRLAWIMPGAVLAGMATVAVEPPEAVSALPSARPPSDKWGVIGRNTLGSPSAQLRYGPYGRTDLDFSARQPPPYGRGSLGLIVGSGNEKIAFGNETDFARTRLTRIRTVRYWVFAGMDSLAGVSLPSFAMEVDPKIAGQSYTTLVYLPNASISPSAPSVRIPNVWQQYDATATGNKWWATNATVATTIGCTQASPCSFAHLKSQLPDAEISYSVAIQKGRDNPFVGAVDGLRMNNVLFDFEKSGVRRRTP